jgi:uncharacterized membrane protein
LNAPEWGLSIAYWLHMLATVVWLGGLAALALIVLPSARRTLGAQAYAQLLDALQSRLDPIGWLSLAVLAATGMFQMSANPNYSGLLAIDNRWAVAILIKHIAIGGMVVASAYQTWVVLPGLRRLALRQARGLEASEIETLRKREATLLVVNLALAVVVLALTAMARSFNELHL